MSRLARWLSLWAVCLGAGVASAAGLRVGVWVAADDAPVPVWRRS